MSSPATVHPTPVAVPPPRGTGASNLGAMILATAERHAGVALRARRGGTATEITYPELGARAREIAQGLVAVGIAPHDSVAILCSTRPEWTLVDAGALCAGATVVPIYYTNSPEECEYVLEHSDARLVVCEDAEQLAKIEQVRERLGRLDHVVTLDGSGGMSLEDLIAAGASVEPGRIDEIVAAIDPDDVATIVYTSGTTGPPKGCRTTHRNFVATIAMYESQLEIGEDERLVIFLFLPLAHTLALITQMVALDFGGTLAFWRGDPKRILEDITESRPTIVPSVPRVFEKIHTKALAGAEEGGRLKRAVFGWAVGVGRRVRALERQGRPVSGLLRGQHRIADHLVLSKVRALFGGELRLAMSGAAPIAPEVLEFFDACGVLVLEGYGMTESTAAATFNTETVFRFGTVGRALPGTEIAVGADGEVLMRGPHIFAGYHKSPDATRDTVDADGWLRSGDIGEIDPDGFLSITGRKKDLIITSSGKNISPANIESALRESRWISQALVCGDNRPYLVALLTLDPEEAPALARRCEVASDDLAVIAADPGVRAEIQREVDAANARFARIEQIKRFAILDHDFAQAAGELTPTMKLKRAVLNERYRDLIESLYAHGGAD